MRIEARDVSFSTGGRKILNSVDLECRGGELLGLIGPNGAGKSTLLKILAGLLTPDEGRVEHDGRPLAAIAGAERARLVSFLPQGGRAEWPLAVRDLVSLGRLPHRGLLAARSRTGDEAAVARAMAAAGVEPFADRDATRLSGGELARVLLARALAVEAPMLLADEPVSQLDPYHQLQIVQLLRDLTRAGTGIVLVLHDLSLAARFCDRLVLMKAGQVLASGDPASVSTDSRLAEAYGVKVVRGEHEGQPFLLPWSTTGG